MSAGSRLHRNALSTVTRPGRAPGKQQINIGDEKLPTTGKAIRSLIRARYIDGNRCAPGSARRGARHGSTRWEPLGEGEARGPGQREPHSWLRGRPWTKEPEREACRLQPGRALWLGRARRGLSGAHGTVSLWGCGWGRPWSSAPCLPARGFWMGPRCPLGLQLPACRSYLGRTGPGLPGGPGSARWAHALPSLSDTCLWPAPSSSPRGQPAGPAPLRDLSSPAGPGGTSEGGSSPGWT